MRSLVLMLSTAGALVAQDRVVVAKVESGAVLVLTDGRRVGLQGVSLPHESVRTADADARLCAFVREQIADGVRLRLDRGAQPGVDQVAMVDVKTLERSLNEEILRRGLAAFACRTKEVADIARLCRAAEHARSRRLGWFGKSARRKLEKFAFLNGAVVGLHHQEPERHYHRQLDELADAGFGHVCLLFSAFLDKVTSVEIRTDHKRTVRDRRLIETIGYARQRGFSVMLLPIVLILEPGEDDWRGVLKPKDEEAFWQNYDRFLAHYLDIAEHTGVDAFSVGSEFGSLEDRTATWHRIIRNARGRFGGMLTYSVNWDHAKTPRFFRELDFVGQTAYFSLTKTRDPDVEDLAKEWRRVAADLAKTHAWHGRPVVFTELGYASQNGINRDPWNYVMAKDDIDLQEQKDCFAAFRRVAAEMEFLGGAYYYDYYDRGGVKDWSYSPRGKPAMEEWKAWARYERERVVNRGGR